ncbi:MAG: hypothetical protein H5T50_01090 [Nitrososphaeria archaeon]|nr:hypothetical protein [Nitrososphaeria archaeon]
MAESVSVPKELLKNLYKGLAEVEEVLATLEELMDKEGLQRIREAEEEYQKGDYVIVENSEEIRKLIE